MFWKLSPAVLRSNKRGQILFLLLSGINLGTDLLRERVCRLFLFVLCAFPFFLADTLLSKQGLHGRSLTNDDELSVSSNNLFGVHSGNPPPPKRK